MALLCMFVSSLSSSCLLYPFPSSSCLTAGKDREGGDILVIASWNLKHYITIKKLMGSLSASTLWYPFPISSCITAGRDREGGDILAICSWTLKHDGYRYYTISLSKYHRCCHYHESMSIPWVHVYTMSPCKFHASMSIPWVLAKNMSQCL